jgi:ABC-type transport system involved in cytochrome bd biosynthesis fused ATPase/permease subunit
MSHSESFCEKSQTPSDMKLKIIDNVAYLPQKPMLYGSTILENIILEKKFDQDRVDWCIKYSAFEDDLVLMERGVDTEIGDSGQS